MFGFFHWILLVRSVSWLDSGTTASLQLVQWPDHVWFLSLDSLGSLCFLVGFRHYSFVAIGSMAGPCLVSFTGFSWFALFLGWIPALQLRCNWFNGRTMFGFFHWILLVRSVSWLDSGTTASLQ